MKNDEAHGGRFPDFRERFDKLRGDMSNTEFAEFLGMSRQTVGFYLNGDRIPDALVLRQIAEKCQVSADWLLGLANTRKRAPSAVDDLCLTEDAVDAIEYMDKELRDVLCFFAEQELFAGVNEEMMSEYLHVGKYCIDTRHHILKQISNFFSVFPHENIDYAISSIGEIIAIDEIEEFPEGVTFIPIDKENLINEAFMSSIRFMLFQLKDEYQKRDRP